MRTGNEPHFLEVGHDIANGRRRKLQSGNFGQRARAYRLAIRDIAFYQGFEQGLCASIKLHGVILAIRRKGG